MLLLWFNIQSNGSHTVHLRSRKQQSHREGRPIIIFHQHCRFAFVRSFVKIFYGHHLPDQIMTDSRLLGWLLACWVLCDENPKSSTPIRCFVFVCFLCTLSLRIAVVGSRFASVACEEGSLLCLAVLVVLRVFHCAFSRGGSSSVILRARMRTVCQRSRTKRSKKAARRRKDRRRAGRARVSLGLTTHPHRQERAATHFFEFARRAVQFPNCSTFARLPTTMVSRESDDLAFFHHAFLAFWWRPLLRAEHFLLVYFETTDRSNNN